VNKTSGLFWTVHIEEGALDVNVEIAPAKGRARVKLRNFEIEDYFDLCNALLDGPNLEAQITLRLDFGGTESPSPYSASGPDFRFQGLRTQARAEWTAREEGFEFRSDPADTSSSPFAAIGEEVNGRFF
jgi:hypothetical protein